MAALSGEKKAVKTNATGEHGTEFRTKIPVKTDGPICFENKVRNLTQTFFEAKTLFPGCYENWMASPADTRILTRIRLQIVQKERVFRIANSKSEIELDVRNRYHRVTSKFMKVPNPISVSI